MVKVKDGTVVIVSATANNFYAGKLGKVYQDQNPQKESPFTVVEFKEGGKIVRHLVRDNDLKIYGDTERFEQ